MVDEHRAKISPEDCVQLDNVDDLPYLKHIELSKLTPRHFGLERWSSSVNLTDGWMRKIYKRNIWKDTDFPEPEEETISPEQKKILNDWVKREAKRLNYETRSDYVKNLRSHKPLDYDLKEVLDKFDNPKHSEEFQSKSDPKGPEKSVPSSPLDELNSDHLPVCLRHKIQPEDTIVKIALQKMMNLPYREELRFRNLIRDKNFVGLLNKKVKDYLTNQNEPNLDDDIAE